MTTPFIKLRLAGGTILSIPNTRGPAGPAPLLRQDGEWLQASYDNGTTYSNVFDMSSILSDLVSRITTLETKVATLEMFHGTLDGDIENDIIVDGDTVTGIIYDGNQV